MAPENELLSSWREELLQQASQGSGREEELEGGGEELEGGIEMLDENSNVEKTITDSESEEQFRASLRREKNRKKKRQRVARGFPIFRFFPNFKCLWGPPRLVRSSSPSGYILPMSLPVVYWVWLFIFFQSVF